MSALPSECEQLLISGYVLGELSPAEAVLLAQMLRENPQLMEQVKTMQQALELVYTPSEVAPPPALRARLMAAANHQNNSNSQKSNSATVKSSGKELETDTIASTSKLPWGRIIGAIVLAVAATLGVTNYLWWHKTIQTAKIKDIRNQNGARLAYLLQDKDPNRQYTAQLTVNRDRLKATLTTNNLPALPPDRAYALWTVVGKDVPYTTDDKGAILTAVFQVPLSGSFTQEIAVPQPHLEPKTIKKIAITVEDVSAPQAHQGSIFISTQD